MFASCFLSSLVLFVFYMVYHVDGEKICQLVSDWKINGMNPVKKNEGKVNVMYILSTSNSSNLYQLRTLDNYAVYYQKIAEAEVNLMAFQPMNVKVGEELKEKYFRIAFYKEPGKNHEVFRRLGGYERDILIYDKCGRLVYQYGYPYSFMGFPFVSVAVMNTLRHSDLICGPCETPNGSVTSIVGQTNATKLINPFN